MSCVKIPYVNEKQEMLNVGENGKASMTLDALEVGACAIIDGVNGSGELRRHLLDMGLTPGVGVRLRKVAPMGDPLQVELRGYELTLRVSDAQQVAITPAGELPAPSYG
ncbi:MAG: ferrous iron transport protein A, partial [Slackia isoflavoniconvertens]|nr:ferrous iron transport protein A [Slackia isoflavoniconvertens]